jgi:transcriptional regulator with XRE-family HTH domain
MTGRPADGQLGAYLKDRRARLDPAALGFPAERRRTPGLRREEVAQRAGISATWYTWLEQGRGGAPSAQALERIAAALVLAPAERENLFLLALGRPPQARYRRNDSVTPRLQRVLDALDPAPALIRTAAWDVLAWNRAATVMLSDFAAAAPQDRNLLRSLFLDPRRRDAYLNWEHVARFVVGAFRIEAARAGASEDIAPLVEELSRASPEFAALWRESPVPGHAEAVKQIRHPVLGLVSFEYSVFAVDARPDLSLLVYNPATADDAAAIAAALKAAP